MRKLLSLTTRWLMTICLLLTGGMTAFADSETSYSPTLDVNFRTGTGNTTWNNGYPKDAANDGNTGFEGNYFAGIFVLQKYTVTDLANATSITLTLTDTGTTGVDGTMVWLYPDNNWTAETSIDDMINNLTTTVGVAPRSSSGTVKSPLATATKVAGSSPAKGMFTISGTALATLKAAADNGTFTLMITDKNLTSNSSRKFYSSNSAVAEANRPTLTAKVETPVVWNQTTSIGYSSLNDAVAAVTGEETLVINKNVELTARVNVPANVKLTIVPAEDGITISRASNNKGNILILPGSGCTLNLGTADKQLIIDGQNVEATTNTIEASNGTVTLTNILFKDCKTTNNQGVVSRKTNSVALIIDGCTFQDCTVPDGRGVIFCGKNVTELRGNNTFSGCTGEIYLEKQLNLKGTNATHTTPIALIIESSRTTGTIVEGGKVAQYTLVGGQSTWQLGQSGNNVVIEEESDPNVVNQNTNKKYADLKSAVAAIAEASEGETPEEVVLLVNVDQEISGSRIDINRRNITLKAGVAGVKISRAAGYTSGMLFLTNNENSTLTLDGITLDGNNVSATNTMIEASNKGLTTLKDVTIQNCTTTSNGVIINKSNGRLVLDGVKFNNCTAALGDVFVGTNNVTLKGANTIPTIYMEHYVLTADNATATAPITLKLKDGRSYGLLVLGGNATQFTNDAFRLSQQVDGVYVMPKAVATSFTHPALLHTSTDIERVKNNLTLEPFAAAYSRLESQSAGSAAGAVEVLKRMDAKNWSSTYSDYNNFSHAATDAKLAYELALRYQLKGNTACADQTVAILNDWATTCKGMLRLTGYANNIPDPNEYLMTIQAYQFANAAELVRDYTGWQASDKEKFMTWMKQTFADVAILFLENHHNNANKLHYWLNWDLATLDAMLSVGILTDDQALVDYALNYTTTGEGTGNVNNAVVATHQDPDSSETLAQCQESGRDQGHATLDVTLLGVLCQTAQNIGTDLFTPYKALEMAEYIGKYNLKDQSDNFVYDESKVPFTTYNYGEGEHTAISADARGTVRPSWELFFAYAKNNSKAAAYTEKWVEYMRTKNAWGEGEATSNDELGFGTLMFATPGDLTGIKGVTNDELRMTNEAGAVYDLQGRKVAETSHFSPLTSHLPKGIYIVNGKKIVIK